MMISNFFMFIPVVASFYMQEWIYCFIASGATIFSFGYHYLKENKLEHRKNFKNIKILDWLFGILAYVYMYYYIFAKVKLEFVSILALALTFTMMLFWYGFKISNYRKTHPWFHILTAVVSGLIVIAK